MPQAKTRPTARKAGVRLAALGRNAEAAEMLLKAGALDAAARCYERAGDHAGVARCHEHAGRWLEAARELGRAPGTDEVRRCAAIQQLLYRHVQSARRQGREEREVQALVREAPRLAEEGNLVAALARYRLCGLIEESVEISRASWVARERHRLAAGNRPLLHRPEVRQAGRVRGHERILRPHGGGLPGPGTQVGRGPRGNPRDSCSAFLPPWWIPFPRRKRGAWPKTTSRKPTGVFPRLDRVPDEDLALLLRTRASSAIISLLGWEMQFLRDPEPRLQEFGERLGREAEESRDPGMGACRAYFSEVMRGRHTGDGFEAAAAQLPLARGTAAILGFSRLRYREAVDFLMEADEVEKAEQYCRFQRDFVLGGDVGGKTKGVRRRGSNFREARDFDGALRCAKASDDSRLVARVHEWRGEPGEALRLWKKLGRPREVERLLKQYPLLRR